MGNKRNKKRKAVRTPPSKIKKMAKHGRYCDENPGPSGMKIGSNTEKIRQCPPPMKNVNEGTIFIDLSVLFEVFMMFYCPECGGNIHSHLDMRKKNGYSHYIILECLSDECEWKYCFNTSKKQGHSHE